MKRKVYQIEGANVSCSFISGSPCDPDEYQVDIELGNIRYSIYSEVGPFESEENICNRVYTEWKNGQYNEVIAETIKYSII